MDVYRTLNLAVPQLLFTWLHQAGPTVAEDDTNDFVPAGEMVKRIMWFLFEIMQGVNTTD